MTELTLEKRIDDLEQFCIKDLASEVEHQELFNTVTDLEKRVENLEKIYLILQNDIDKKLEMLRENNNLFATEIKKLGGFQEDDDFEALDLSPVKELMNLKEKGRMNEYQN